jgi:hypothetical protein
MRTYKHARYQIKVSLDDPGRFGYIAVRDKVEFCLKTARKHLKDVKPCYAFAEIEKA